MKDVEGFSHLIILWIFPKSKGYSLHVKPIWQRLTRRFLPQDILKDLISMHACTILKAGGVDMVDGIPVVDIKSYTSRDRKEDIRAGWLEEEALIKSVMKGRKLNLFS